MKYILGIDEVGRGPLAGPVAVGVFVLEKKNLKKVKNLYKLAKDSKKLSSKKREEIFQIIKEYQKLDILRYIVRYESSKVIDKLGINKAIELCISKSFKQLKLKAKECEVFLDGGLKAPKEFIFQKTIIKGDDKIKVISLASIVAKVSRDSLMQKMAKKYPEYGLDIHKGYGTRQHRDAITKNGLSTFHRRTFCGKC